MSTVAWSGIPRNGTISTSESLRGPDPLWAASQVGVLPAAATPGPFRMVAIDPRVRLAEAIMYHNLSRAMSLSDLARRTGVSVSRLSHLFKDEVGTSPRQYLKSLRLRRARYLLENSLLSVKEVAAQVGLTAGALIRDFRRAHGTSPGRHRRCLGAAEPIRRGPELWGDVAGAAGSAYKQHESLINRTCVGETV